MSDKYISDFSKQLDLIEQRKDNWDGNGSLKPVSQSIIHVKKNPKELIDVINFEDPPFISTDEDGYITIEWYKEKRELHLRIQENEIECTKVQQIYGQTEVHSDMVSSEDCFMLWTWLYD